MSRRVKPKNGFLLRKVLTLRVSVYYLPLPFRLLLLFFGG